MNNILGEKIRKFREEKELSLTDLSKKVGVDISHLSNIENGRRLPSYSLLSRIAEVLQVQYNQLLGEINTEMGGSEKYILTPIDIHKTQTPPEELQTYLAKAILTREKDEVERIINKFHGQFKEPLPDWFKDIKAFLTRDLDAFIESVEKAIKTKDPRFIILINHWLNIRFAQLICNREFEVLRKIQGCMESWKEKVEDYLNDKVWYSLYCCMDLIQENSEIYLSSTPTLYKREYGIETPTFEEFERIAKQFPTLDEEEENYKNDASVKSQNRKMSALILLDLQNEICPNGTFYRSIKNDFPCLWGTFSDEYSNSDEYSESDEYSKI